MEDKKIWGIHTLNDHMMLDKNLIAIGWTEMGNLTGIPAEREAFKQKYREIYPDAKVQSVANSAGMLYRLYTRLQWVTMLFCHQNLIEK